MVLQTFHLLLIGSPELLFLVLGLLFEKEAIFRAIFFCTVGLPLFGKEDSGTPVFKILVRALWSLPGVHCALRAVLCMDYLAHLSYLPNSGDLL